MWLTSDGVPVLNHDAKVGRGLWRRRLAAVPRSALPDSVLSLTDLYAECGTGFELSLDVYDPDAVRAVVDVARAAGGGAAGRLWLCHPDWELLAGWRANWADVHLVNSTRKDDLRQGAERRAAQLSEAGVDAVNLHHSDWTGGLTTLFHRFGRLAFAWGAQHERVVRALARMGIDGVYGDHVDRLVDGLR